MNYLIIIMLIAYEGGPHQHRYKKSLTLYVPEGKDVRDLAESLGKELQVTFDMSSYVIHSINPIGN
jgi:hypothetical protein